MQRVFKPVRDLGDAFAAFHVGENKWFVATHFLGIVVHYLQTGADVRRQIGFC